MNLKDIENISDTDILIYIKNLTDIDLLNCFMTEVKMAKWKAGNPYRSEYLKDLQKMLQNQIKNKETISIPHQYIAYCGKKIAVVSESIEFPPAPSDKRFDKIIDIIEKEIKKYNIDEVPGKPKDQPKKFEDYLLCPDRDKLMFVLHKLLNGQKGMQSAKVILALQKKGYLPPNKKSELWNSLISEFGINGNISAFYTYLGNNSIPKNEIDNIINLFP